STLTTTTPSSRGRAAFRRARVSSVSSPRSPRRHPDRVAYRWTRADGDRLDPTLPCSPSLGGIAALDIPHHGIDHGDHLLVVILDPLQAGVGRGHFLGEVGPRLANDVRGPTP